MYLLHQTLNPYLASLAYHIYLPFLANLFPFLVLFPECCILLFTYFFAFFFFFLLVVSFMPCFFVAASACNNEQRIPSPVERLMGTNVVRHLAALPTSRIISKYCVNNNKSMTSLAFAVVSLENSTILCIQKKETDNVRVRGMYVRKEIYTHQQTNKQNN